jgi:hypothetical protein
VRAGRITVRACTPQRGEQVRVGGRARDQHPGAQRETLSPRGAVLDLAQHAEQAAACACEFVARERVAGEPVRVVEQFNREGLVAQRRPAVGTAARARTEPFAQVRGLRGKPRLGRRRGPERLLRGRVETELEEFVGSPAQRVVQGGRRVARGILGRVEDVAERRERAAAATAILPGEDAGARGRFERGRTWRRAAERSERRGGPHAVERGEADDRRDERSARLAQRIGRGTRRQQIDAEGLPTAVAEVREIGGNDQGLTPATVGAAGRGRSSLRLARTQHELHVGRVASSAKLAIRTGPADGFAEARVAVEHQP